MPQGIRKNLAKSEECVIMKLGDKLRTHWEKRQWMQPKAAEVIGIEQSSLSKLENDHSIPSIEVFRRFIDAYETDVAELMDGIDPGDFAHLVQITDVADYLNAERQATLPDTH
jgi:transcriptional regulator with XRE-family HTH domain